MWNWLDQYQERIRTIAVVVQTTVVVGGIGFAVTEYIVEDQIRTADKVETALGYVEKLAEVESAEADSEISFFNGSSLDPSGPGLREYVFGLEKELAAKETIYYAIRRCLGTDACDRRVVFDLICPIVFVDKLRFDSVRKSFGAVQDGYWSDVWLKHEPLTLEPKNLLLGNLLPKENLNAMGGEVCTAEAESRSKQPD